MGYTGPQVGSEGPSMAMVDDQTRLREALEQIANALQPAVVLVGQLQRESAATAQDASIVEAALTRTMAILKTVQQDRSE